ncbi:MAG: M50 family metallopeptidase [Fimbriiglobus sp.]
MTLPDLLIAFPLLTVSWFVVTWVHELGHAVAARLVGLTVTSVGTGIGSVVAHGQVAGTILYVAARAPFQGITFAAFTPRTTRRQMAVFFLGGIVANAVVATAIGVSLGFRPPANWYSSVWMFGAVNAGFAVLNLMPLTVPIAGAAMFSDGRRLLRIVRGIPEELRPTGYLNLHRALGPLWNRIGDVRMRALFLAGASNAWCQFRNFERVDALLADPGCRTDTGCETTPFLIALTRAELAQSRDRHADADAALADAARLAQGSTPPWETVVELCRAEFLIRRGDVSAAAEILRTTAGAEGLAANAQLSGVHQTLAHRAGLSVTPAEVPHWPGDTCPTYGYSVSMTTAERAAEAGDWQAVECATTVGLRYLGAIRAELSHPDDKSGLDPLHAETLRRLDEARTKLGKPAPTVGDLDIVPVTQIFAHERRQFRRAVVLVLLGVVCFTSAALFARANRDWSIERKWGAAAVSFASFIVVFGGAISVVVGAVSRVRLWLWPATRPTYGTQMLQVILCAYAMAVIVGFGMYFNGP